MATSEDQPDTPHYLGHRARLRQRLLTHGAEALQDYEVLEVILATAIPRRDVKPLAKALLSRFGGLAGVLRADPSTLLGVSGVKEATAALLVAAGAAAGRALREEVTDRPLLNAWDRLLDYCRLTMGSNAIEVFRVLYLDTKNRLIADEEQQRGTVDHTPVYPREVVKRALELHASAIILVHNHPSGDPTPSRADISMTHEVIKAAKALGIRVHDHVIVTRTGHFSLRAEDLMPV